MMFPIDAIDIRYAGHLTHMILNIPKKPCPYLHMNVPPDGAPNSA